MGWERRFGLRVDAVVFEESGVFVVQCLQHDIAQQGSSVPLAKKRFVDMLCAHLLADIAATGASSLPDRAPQRFWEMILRGKPERHEVPIFLPQQAAKRHDARVVFHVVQAVA